MTCRCRLTANTRRQLYPQTAAVRRRASNGRQ